MGITIPESERGNWSDGVNDDLALPGALTRLAQLASSLPGPPAAGRAGLLRRVRPTSRLSHFEGSARCADALASNRLAILA
jgi:hypothetical protein